MEAWVEVMAWLVFRSISSSRELGKSMRSKWMENDVSPWSHHTRRPSCTLKNKMGTEDTKKP